MSCLADYLDEGEMADADLTEQRDTLLKSFIGAQRLALAVSKASYSKAKLKAFTRYWDEAQNGKS